MKLQKLILYIFLIIGIFSSSHALIVDSVYGDLTDGQICNKIDDLEFPDQRVIDEARKRGLKCDTVNFSIPKNAHEFNGGWVCNKDFYKSHSECLPAPFCTTSPDDSNELFCKNGCELNDSGNGCNKISTFPKNASKVGSSWACNSSYYKLNSECKSVPSNSYSPEKNNLFFCNSGYKKVGLSCVKKVTPPTNPANSHIDGASWTCNTNYYKSDSACRKVPTNAYSPFTSNLWFCNSGYIKNAIGNGCVTKPTTPKKIKKKNTDLTSFLILIVIVVVLWFIFKPSSSKPTPRSTPRTQPKYKPTPIPKPQPTHPSKYKPPLKPQPKPAQRSQPKPAQRSQPKPAQRSQPKHVNRIKDLPALLIKIGNYNCSELTNEFREWNGRLLQAKTTEESKDIQKILDFIGKRREDNNC